MEKNNFIKEFIINNGNDITCIYDGTKIVNKETGATIVNNVNYSVAYVNFLTNYVIKTNEICVGDTFLCIKDVICPDTMQVFYKKGDIYVSEKPNCITDIYEDTEHHWLNGENELFFNKISSQDIKHSDDKVNHPSHYTWLKDLCGVEVIDITRHMDFNLGNVIKYTLRAGHKSEDGYSDIDKTIEDLQKAIFYLNDEIELIKKTKKLD